MGSKELFTTIYEKGIWGNESKFYSGPGSHEEYIVKPYVDKIVSFLKLYGNINAVDLGCGDFFIGSQIAPYCKSYVACDVVESLIEYNKERFPEIDFRVLDAVTNELPDGDIIFIRQVLQHLTENQIKQIIPKLSKFKLVVITEHLNISSAYGTNRLEATKKLNEVDLQFSLANGASGIILTEEPYNMKVFKNNLLCSIADKTGGGLINTNILYMQRG